MTLTLTRERAAGEWLSLDTVRARSTAGGAPRDAAWREAPTASADV